MANRISRNVHPDSSMFSLVLIKNQECIETMHTVFLYIYDMHFFNETFLYVFMNSVGLSSLPLALLLQGFLVISHIFTHCHGRISNNRQGTLSGPKSCVHFLPPLYSGMEFLKRCDHNTKQKSQFKFKQLQLKFLLRKIFQ